MRLIAVFLATTILATADTTTIGTVTARPGQRATGFLQVPAGVDAAASIPVVVISGAKPGPTLALIAGAHGTEYASIVALVKLGKTVDPAALSGTLVIVPLLNVASFSQKVPHLNPIDGKNMNRLYPGKADGTQTERISWAIARQVLDKCDYLIDYHGGDLDENLRPYAYWADTGNAKLDTTSRGMVLAFGFDHIIIQRNTGPAPTTMNVSRYAQTLGKPTIVVEAGYAGTTKGEDVDALVHGTMNVMRHLKMLPGSVMPVENPIWIGRYSTVASEQDGIFHPLVVPEAYVKERYEVRLCDRLLRRRNLGRDLAGFGRRHLYRRTAVDEKGRHHRLHRRIGGCSLDRGTSTIEYDRYDTARRRTD